MRKQPEGASSVALRARNGESEGLRELAPRHLQKKISTGKIKTRQIACTIAGIEHGQRRPQKRKGTFVQKYNVYSVRDSKSETFSNPVYFKTHGEAERAFSLQATNKETLMGQFPEDYDLYHLGTFLDTTGQIEAFDTPNHIIKAINAVRQ